MGLWRPLESRVLGVRSKVLPALALCTSAAAATSAAVAVAVRVWAAAATGGHTRCILGAATP